MKHLQQEIQVDSLTIDPDNPRFFHLKELHGRKKLTQEELLKEIGDDRELITLTKSIKKEGVKDPIWVKPIERGKYLVIEGNRRTCVLKLLIKEAIAPPKGIRYDVVTANAVAKETSTQELLVLKISLQTGKKPWGAFNEAAATYELSTKHLMADEDIADRSQISVKEVKRRIEDFLMFQEYAQNTGQRDPRQFSYIHQMPASVREWVSESQKNKETYFKLISPDPETGVQRLRKIATKGGVRDFSQILPYPKILDAFLRDDEVSVGDALEMVKEHDVWKKFDWLKGANKLANQLQMLDEDDLEKIKHEIKAVRTIKRVYKNIERILEKLGNGNK